KILFSQGDGVAPTHNIERFSHPKARKFWVENSYNQSLPNDDARGLIANDFRHLRRIDRRGNRCTASQLELMLTENMWK
ncbi:MAG TPA: hypothetical protein K8V32_13510, partial [Enteractinococcus helveticum]